MIHHKVLAQPSFTAPIKLDPSIARPPSDYSKSIIANSKIILNEVQLELKKRFSDVLPTDPCFFVTTGSDGRFEKSNYSKVDLLFYFDGQKMDATRIQELTQRIHTFCVERPDLLSKQSEIKDMGRQRPLYFKTDDGRELFFPTRCLDATFLFGNNDQFTHYKHKIADITAEEAAQFQNTRLRHAKEVVEKGIQKVHGSTLCHFDLTKGELYYSASDVGNLTVRSTKHGHLRGVQYKVSVIIFNALLDKTLTLEDYDQLPNTTVDRILFLQKKSILHLDDTQVTKLIDAYHYAIQLYHLSEMQAIQHCQSTLKVNSLEFQNHTQTIKNFLKLKVTHHE